MILVTLQGTSKLFSEWLLHFIFPAACGYVLGVHSSDSHPFQHLMLSVSFILVIAIITVYDFSELLM